MEIPSNRGGAGVIKKQKQTQAKKKQLQCQVLVTFFQLVCQWGYKPPLPKYKLLHCSWSPSRTFQCVLLLEAPHT